MLKAGTVGEIKTGGVIDVVAQRPCGGHGGVLPSPSVRTDELKEGLCASSHLPWGQPTSNVCFKQECKSSPCLDSRQL